MSRFKVLAVQAAVGVACALACSPDSGSSDANGKIKGNGSKDGTGGESSSSVDGGPGSGLGAGPGFTDYETREGGTSATDKDANCGALVLAPEAVKVEKEIPSELNCTADSPEPISLYLVLDNSGSMKDNNKWNDAVSAITAFVQSDPTLTGTWKCVDKEGKDVTPPADLKPPGSGTISVAIQYFHPINVGNSPDECNGVAHATPAVAMGEIPANAANVTASLAATGPTGNTPTVGALTGGTKYCSDFQAANPGKKCIVVLITDGQPNDCGLSSTCPTGGGRDCVDPKSLGVLQPIVGVPFNAPNSVVTFTVGMNGVNAAGFTLLDAIAVAGGSDCTPGTPGAETCNVTTGGSQGFLAALNTIRNTVQVTTTSSQTIKTTITQTTTLPCEWGIPEPSDGQKFAKDLVNVNFSVGGAVERLGNVAASADCSSVGGWYYDDPDKPTRILSCPDTCTRVQSEEGAKVEILLGCRTEPAIAR